MPPWALRASLPARAARLLLGGLACAPAASPSSPAESGTYVEGPRVGNFAVDGLCGAAVLSQEDAMDACDADADCGVIYAYDCVGSFWRACSATLQDLQVGPGAGGVRRLHHGPQLHRDLRRRPAGGRWRLPALLRRGRVEPGGSDDCVRRGPVVQGPALGRMRGRLVAVVRRAARGAAADRRGHERLHQGAGGRLRVGHEHDHCRHDDHQNHGDLDAHAHGHQLRGRARREQRRLHRPLQQYFWHAGGRGGALQRGPWLRGAALLRLPATVLASLHGGSGGHPGGGERFERLHEGCSLPGHQHRHVGHSYERHGEQYDVDEFFRHDQHTHVHYVGHQCDQQNH